MITSEGQKRDLGWTIESTLREIYLLGWRALRTAWEYNFRAEAFDTATIKEPPSADALQRRHDYLPPITYLALTWSFFCLSTRYHFAGRPLRETPGIREYEFIIRSISSGDLTLALLVVVPLILAVALYSAATLLAIRIVARQIVFELALGINAYFVGTVLLIAAIGGTLEKTGFLIMDEAAGRLEVVGILLMVLGVLVSLMNLRAIYRYVAQLRLASSGNWLQTLAIAAIAPVIVAPLVTLTFIVLGAPAVVWYRLGK